MIINPNPKVKVNGTDSTYAVTVSPSSSPTISLVDTAGVNSWILTCISTDEGQDYDAINDSIVIDDITKTATFDCPSTVGSAFIFESKVNNGFDANGIYHPEYVSTFKVQTVTVAGLKLLAFNESMESDPQFGWTGSLNSAIRSISGTVIPPYDVNAVADTLVMRDEFGNVIANTLQANFVTASNGAIFSGNVSAPDIIVSNDVNITRLLTVGDLSSLKGINNTGNIVNSGTITTDTMTGTTSVTTASLFTPSISHPTNDIEIKTTGVGKYVLIDGKTGTAIRSNGNNMITVTSNVTLSTSLNFQFNIDGLISHLATASGTGKKLTVQSQTTGSGKGGDVYIKSGQGSSNNHGDLFLSRNTIDLLELKESETNFYIQDAVNKTVTKNVIKIIGGYDDPDDYYNAVIKINGDIQMSPSNAVDNSTSFYFKNLNMSSQLAGGNFYLSSGSGDASTNAGNITLQAGNIMSGSNDAGHIIIAGGYSDSGKYHGNIKLLTSSSGADNFANLHIFTENSNSGVGSRTIIINNCYAAPSGNNTSGGILYVQGGALKYRGSSGTVTTLGSA